MYYIATSGAELCVGLTSLRGSQENELDEEGEVWGGVGGAQLGQLPGHEEVTGGFALIHLPREEERNVTHAVENLCTMHVVQCTYNVLYMY